jgi:hypothetical protein
MRKQAELNALLDLDKHEAQVVAEGTEEEKVVAASFAGRLQRDLSTGSIAGEVSH